MKTVRDTLSQPGRLALRSEGEYWNAYYALPDTMDGAVLLGTIRITAVVDNPERKQAFMDLMRGIVTEFLEEMTGVEVAWPNPPEPAPEHERSGSA
jgi:hypothetical protein